MVVVAGVEVDLRAADLVEEFGHDVVPHVFGVTEAVEVALPFGLVLEVGDLDEHVADTLRVFAVEVGKGADPLVSGGTAVEHDRALMCAAEGGQVAHVVLSTGGASPLLQVLFYMQCRGCPYSWQNIRSGG
ncbi:hypothetical protein ACFW91_12535 [Streptomyces asoensis]|uniref:hypothetical protein n=1 Tax=Streptomyces asoensis TaxID=249586 RepID=UPI0036AC51DC